MHSFLPYPPFAPLATVPYSDVCCSVSCLSQPVSQYTQKVDRLAHRRNVTPDYQIHDFYGQLLSIYVVNVPPAPENGIANSETVLLAAIQTTKVFKTPGDMLPFYKDQGPVDVVDLNTIQCVVGRVRDGRRGYWGIVDRSGPLAEATFTD